MLMASIAARGPQALLPTEIWEHVFSFLSLEASEPSVLSYAPTCRTFCHLASRLQLSRNGFSPETLLQERVDFSGAELSALAYHTPPDFNLAAKEMRCVLAEREEMMRGTRALRSVVSSTRELRSLEIEFELDPFLAPREGGIRETIFECVSGALADLASRVDGPTFVVLTGEIFSCRPADILQWKLHDFRYHPALPWLARRQNPQPTEYPTDFRRSTYHDGSFGSLPTLRQLHSLSLTLVDDKFSILMLNPADMIYFRLGRWHSGGHPAVEPYVPGLLRRLQLPELRALCVYGESIDASALTQFLSAHDKLEMLDYHAPAKDWWKRTSPDPTRSLLESQSITHPELSTIRLCTAHFRTTAGHILPDLVKSPKLSFVEILFSATTRGERAAQMLVDIQSLGNRPVGLGYRTITLNLVDSETFGWDFKGHGQTLRRRLRRRLPHGAVDIKQPPSEEDLFWALTTTALSLAPTLQCVSTVWVAPLTYNTARRMLPWLGLLPALTHLSFGFTVKYLNKSGLRWEESYVDGKSGNGKVRIWRKKKTRKEIEEDVVEFMDQVVKKGLPGLPSIVHVVWD
ncbi:hypothetical protein HMN09_00363900 [Mycena chlorophos]|uniref:F-box domain-containing protein n=1 Tax=Mycena chlorophos TaxID=658473 RepID=A0A8H6TGZ8_MYCCL|nr:hypothetical protein HMN09_00363900 [Mycena chlorophos]